MLSGWCAPAGGEIVARNSREPGIISQGDVVKIGRVVQSLANRVDERVEKTDTGLLVGHSLLISQRDETCPQRRRCACAAHRDRMTVTLNQEHLHSRRERHVGDISHGGRSTARNQVESLLVARNWIGGADSAAAAGPCRFRLPRSARANGREAGAAHNCDVWVIRGRLDPSFICAAVAGRLEEGLSLDNVLLEYLLGCSVDRAEAPRRAELLRQIVGGHEGSKYRWGYFLR